MARKSFVMDEDMPGIAQAIAILNAVPIPELPVRKPITRFWELHIARNSSHWVVVNASHAIFHATTEEEAATFLAGCIAATDRLLRAFPPEPEDAEVRDARG